MHHLGNCSIVLHLSVTIPSGYYLTHWDIPLISLSSNNPDISDKDVYSTVIRVGMGYKQIGYAFVEVMCWRILPTIPFLKTFLTILKFHTSFRTLKIIMCNGIQQLDANIWSKYPNCCILLQL